MTKNEIIEHWLSSSNNDYRVVESLFDNGHYVWALFIAHLVLEKLIKAYYVKEKDDNVPFSHDLLKLAERSSLGLTDTQKIFLDEMTSCNISARYPDFKNRFYKKATKEFTQDKISRLKEFRTWLLEKIKS
jgi:HEPN domain-containing protein